MPGTTDTVKAKLTPGEFVIRKEAVDMIGVPMLNKLNNMPEEGGHSAIDRIIDMAFDKVISCQSTKVDYIKFQNAKFIGSSRLFYALTPSSS